MAKMYERFTVIEAEIPFSPDSLILDRRRDPNGDPLDLLTREEDGDEVALVILGRITF